MMLEDAGPGKPPRQGEDGVVKIGSLDGCVSSSGVPRRRAPMMHVSARRINGIFESCASQNCANDAKVDEEAQWIVFPSSERATSVRSVVLLGVVS